MVSIELLRDDQIKERKKEQTRVVARERIEDKQAEGLLST